MLWIVTFLYGYVSYCCMKASKSITFELMVLTKAENFLKRRPDLNLSKFVNLAVKKELTKAMTESVAVKCKNCMAEYASILRACPQCSSVERDEI